MILIQSHSSPLSNTGPASVLDLKEADAYVIKLQTHRNEALFGVLADGVVVLNEMGQIVADEWVQASLSHRDVRLDTWVVRPTYIKGIIMLPTLLAEMPAPTQTAMTSTKPRLLSSFVAGFKAAAAKRINLLRSQPGLPVWQRSYSETLIPDELTLQRVRQLLHLQTD